MTDRLELFDSWAEHYDELLEDEAGFPFEGYSSALEQVVAFADPAPGSSVLDLGAGTGALASRFLKLGYRVTGVDFSAEMLRRAQARFPQAAWLQADLLADWPEALSSGEFDLVVSAYVFHEFTTGQKLELIGKVFSEALKPGGRLLIADIAFPDSSALEACRAEWREQWDESEHYWLADEMLGVLNEAGIQGSFTPVSFCAGVFCLQKAPPDQRTE